MKTLVIVTVGARQLCQRAFVTGLISPVGIQKLKVPAGNGEVILHITPEETTLDLRGSQWIVYGFAGNGQALEAQFNNDTEWERIQ